MKKKKIMEIEYRRIEFDDGATVVEEPKNVFDKKCPEQCCLTCKHSEKLYTYNGQKDTRIGCWHASDECGEPDHRWCQDNGDKFKCTDWIDKDTKVTPKLNFWTCKCKWDDYFDFRIIANEGIGHVRVSFFSHWVTISDLFVREEFRNRRYATALLDYVDELINKFAPGVEVDIVPLTDWEKDWYIRRGYKIVEE
jgi:GNAT superfamily N-acetyltransferase